MPNELKRQSTPEEQELERKRAELAAREALLAERELQLATLSAELTAFNRRYQQAVAARYAELDEIEARISEASARNRPADTAAQQHAATARERAAASAQTASIQDEPSRRLNFKPSDQLKNLYREVAKALHPDLATDEDERARRHKFMRISVTRAKPFSNHGSLRISCVFT